MPFTSDDRWAIQDHLMYSYRCLDTHDSEAWVHCFTDDAEFVAAYGTYTGHDGIREFMQAHIAAGREEGARHFVTNFAVTGGDGDEAEAICYIDKQQVVEPPRIWATAELHLKYRRTADGWRFTRFALKIDPGVFAAQEAAAAAAH